MLRKEMFKIEAKQNTIRIIFSMLIKIYKREMVVNTMMCPFFNFLFISKLNQLTFRIILGVPVNLVVNQSLICYDVYSNMFTWFYPKQFSKTGCIRVSSTTKYCL